MPNLVEKRIPHVQGCLENEKRIEKLEKLTSTANIDDLIKVEYENKKRFDNIEDRQDFHEELNATIIQNTEDAIKKVVKMSAKKLIDEIEKKADTDGNGTTTPVEWLTYLLRNPIFILIGVLLISINPFKDFLINGLQTNVWDWSNLIGITGSSIILFGFYIFSKTSDRQSTKVINQMAQELKDKDITIFELRDELHATKATKELLQYENKKLIEENEKEKEKEKK